MEIGSLSAFVVAALVVLVLPGPGVLYVVARSVRQGRKAGLVSAAGLSLGVFTHVLAAALGLSAILLTSATAFGAVKTAGAAYLVYLGVRAILSRDVASVSESEARRSLRRLFLDGVLVSALNPKIALFFLAFLPQFVDPGRGSVTLQVVVLGTLYALLALMTDGTYALVAGQSRKLLAPTEKPRVWPRYAEGLTYIGLGVRTAFAERS